MIKSLFFILISFVFIGCSQKQPIVSQSATIVFKTPLMKFYDKGFVTHYDDHIHLQILNLGTVILDLKIYDDEICRATFECLESQEFNSKYLNKNYDKNFMLELFKKDTIHFKDKQNNILIKVRKD